MTEKRVPYYTDGIPGGTKKGELHRTAEILVEIVNAQGIYYAVAFLMDSQYDLATIKQLLPILEKQNGAIKSHKSPFI